VWAWISSCMSGRRLTPPSGMPPRGVMLQMQRHNRGLQTRGFSSRNSYNVSADAVTECHDAPLPLARYGYRGAMARSKYTVRHESRPRIDLVGLGRDARSSHGLGAIASLREIARAAVSMRPHSAVTIGRLTDATGFPLAVEAFEGNKAETATMVSDAATASWPRTGSRTSQLPMTGLLSPTPDSQSSCQAAATMFGGRSW
jgi:hypothetical protein